MTYKSSCCGAEMTPEYRDIEMCPECHEHCGVEQIFDCDECEDTGIVTIPIHDEHGATVDEQTKKCPCAYSEDGYDER